MNESATIALADRVRKLTSEGKKVIALQTGDPNFPTPQPIIEAASKAMKLGMTHYANSRGLPELREAIAKKILDMNKVSYNPDTELLVTSGGVHAYFCALKAILNPGDEVLVPDPSWMTHVNVVTLLGGKAVRVPSAPENEFWPKMEQWSQSLSKKTVALVINTPNNPTGAVASKEYLEEIVNFALKNNIYIISDEVYESILFDGNTHVCAASLEQAKERTILINSFSKTYAMTGWRIGYLAAPAQIISQALKASQNTITNVAPFVQYAAICALTNPDVSDFVKNMVHVYEERRNKSLEFLCSIKEHRLKILKPKGAFYLFLNLRGFGIPSEFISEQLLDKYLVSMVPGSVYGECGEGMLRITMAASEEDIMIGLERLTKWIQKNTK